MQKQTVEPQQLRQSTPRRPAMRPLEDPQGNVAASTVPDYYRRLPGASLAATPTPVQRLRLFLHGAVGEGKTTFCLSIPRCILFDFENKASCITTRAPGTLVVHCKRGEEYDAIIQRLIEDAARGALPFDYVVFDPITSYIQLERVALTELYRAEGLFDGPGDITSYGKKGLGWDTVNNKVVGQLIAIYNAGYGRIVTAHMMRSWKRLGERDEAVWESAVNPGILRFLYMDAEFTGSLQRQVELVRPTEQQTIRGRTISVQSKARATRRYTYWLDLLPNDDKLPIRRHIDMGDEPIEVPAGRGFEAFVAAYQAAVSRTFGNRTVK